MIRFLVTARAVRSTGSLAAPRDERGATAVEYGLMVCFIAAVIVVAVTAFGLAVSGAFGSFNSQWP